MLNIDCDSSVNAEKHAKSLNNAIIMINHGHTGIWYCNIYNFTSYIMSIVNDVECKINDISIILYSTDVFYE